MRVINLRKIKKILIYGFSFFVICIRTIKDNRFRRSW